MKTKMMKKLISLACAAAMATSCTAMSVGAVPIAAMSQEDWEEGRNRARNLLNRANELIKQTRDVKNYGYCSDKCQKLADELEAFFRSVVYVEATCYFPYMCREESAAYILNKLRSHYPENWWQGAEQATGYLAVVVANIENHIDAPNM